MNNPAAVTGTGRFTWGSVGIGALLLALPGLLPAADKAPGRAEDVRPNAVAFRQMRHGIFITQTYGLTAWPGDRKQATLDEFANAFDVPAFADQMASIGVEYVYFTAWHKSIYLLGPNKALEKWLPGHTAKRDLVGEIADALHARNIKLVIYAHPNDGHDLTPEEQAKVGFLGRDKDKNRKYNDFINEVFDELTERYGGKPNVLGYWWDSWWHNGQPIDVPRLRKTVLARFPGAVILSNNYDPRFIDFLSGEGGRMSSLDGMRPTKDNQTWYLGGDWWNNNPNTTIPITPEAMYRFLLLSVGAGAPGGMAWALSPLADGKTWGANNQPLKVMQELNRRIAPVRPTVCGVLPSCNWLLPPGTVWSKAPAFVAARSPSNDKEFIHVLKPPQGRSIDLPLPADSFSTACLYLNRRPVTIEKQTDSFRLTLPDGENWGPLDTVIELTVAPAAAGGQPLRIMCVGDSITAGYTDNPSWNVPFEFGYRGALYQRLTRAGYSVQFVGASPEPWNGAFGRPRNTPSPDLRALGQDGHRGYGGWNTGSILANIEAWLAADRPDVVLLMIGINDGGSPAARDNLNRIVQTVVTRRPEADLIVAQITPTARHSKSIVDYNSYIRNTLVPGYRAKGHRVSAVDQYRNLLTNGEIDPKLFSNGINHPDAAAYDRMAQTWFDGIRAVRPLPETAGGKRALAAGREPAVFHVAPGGNDTHPGTVDKPLATIAAARDAARRAPGPNTIVLEPGRYFNAESVVFDDRDSGLTVRGKGPGATAEVYGGLAVTGWEKWKGNIWRAPVPKGKRFFNLIVDGKPATMAQTPNAGSGFGGGAAPRGNTALVVPPEWRGYDYSDAQVFTFIGANWFSEMREVLKPAPDVNGVLPIDAGSDGFGGMNDRFFLRGVLEFLDEPGEWCLKHKEGFVYYWPADGTPAEHVIVRPTAEKLFEVRGRTGQTPAKNVVIESLSLIGSDFCARWYLFGPGKDGSTPEPLQQGLVFGENVEGMKVRNCRILAAGHSGVWLNHRAQDCVVENCLIAGAGFAGVYANGFLPGEGPFKSGPESHVNRGHRVENNFIYDCGKFVGGGCGIQFFQSGHSLITRNEIGEMPRYGISFKGAGWGLIPKTLYGHKLTFYDYFDYVHTRHLKVTGNEIYSVCRNSFDFGGIESWCPGRDNLWAGNDLHDIDQTLDWNGWAHVLFADDASHWLTISGNIIHHCNGGQATGAFMLKNIEETIENNLVADCDIGRLVTFEPFAEPAWNMSIRHNIFAVDGANTRYGNINPYSLQGKPLDGVEVPKGASGFREVNNNWIAPRDPKNPNPLASVKMDCDSTFGPAPVKRLKPDWDAVAADYQVTPPKWFKPIDASQMGLKKDFPFDKLAFTRRLATGKIQAEGYQRTHLLRTGGGAGIYNLVPGAWAKYANIDFGKGVSKALFRLDPQADATSTDPLIELRLDSPEGRVVGRILPGRSECGVENAAGVHNLYLIFPGGKVNSVDWFRFEP